MTTLMIVFGTILILLFMSRGRKGLLYGLFGGFFMIPEADLGLQLSAFVLLGIIVLLFLYLAFYTGFRTSRKDPVYYLLFFFFFYVIAETARVHDEFAIRMLLKYIYPFLVFWFASTMDVFADFRLTKPNATLAPWDFDGVLEGFDEGALNHFKAPPLLYKRLLYCLCAFVAVISVLGGGFLYKLSPTLYERFEVICPARACAAMYLSGLSILLFAYVFSRPRLARRDIFCIGLAFWCMANNLFGAFRMALFAGTVGIALLFFFLKPAKNKLTICIALVAIVGAFAAKPLITNVVDKMTFTGETSVGAISSGDVRIRDNGRAEMRRVMTQYVLKDNYLFGAGCGRSQGYLYNNPVSDKIKVCHNEFLRLVCDLGIVGTIAYCAVLLCLLLRAFSISVRAPNALKCASSAVFSLIVMVTLIMMTDNVLDYFGVSGFVFALAGLISNPRYAELLCCEWL